MAISKSKRNKIMKEITKIYYTDYREKISLVQVSQKTKLPIDEIVSICVNLESYKYINCCFEKENKEYFSENNMNFVKYNKPKENLFVVIEDSGKHYFEIKKDAFFDFLKRSIFTPIIVSFLTTLLTHYLTKFLA